MVFPRIGLGSMLRGIPGDGRIVGGWGVRSVLVVKKKLEGVNEGTPLEKFSDSPKLLLLGTQKLGRGEFSKLSKFSSF